MKLNIRRSSLFEKESVVNFRYTPHVDRQRTRFRSDNPDDIPENSVSISISTSQRYPVFQTHLSLQTTHARKIKLIAGSKDLAKLTHLQV